MPENNTAGNATPFLTDVATLRERARKHMDAGAVTANYGADPALVVKVLNEALATEIEPPGAPRASTVRSRTTPLPLIVICPPAVSFLRP